MTIIERVNNLITVANKEGLVKPKGILIGIEEAREIARMSPYSFFAVLQERGWDLKFTQDTLRLEIFGQKPKAKRGATK